MSQAEYSQLIRDLDGKRLKNEEEFWKEVVKSLQLAGCAHFEVLQTLRLLANAYKHDPLKSPGKKLLDKLGLDAALTYAELPESDALRNALASKLGLPGDAEYCEIAEQFVEYAQEFLRGVQTRNKLSRFRGGMAGLLDVAY